MRLRKQSKYLAVLHSLTLVITLAAHIEIRSVQADEGPELRKLAYNHPGLVVDLGVGLWAWPIPWDADGDGDYDLLVSCPDKPSNGVWFFENASGDTKNQKLPIFRPGKRLSKTVHYVMPSYVDGKMRILSPGWEYPNFLSKGTDDRIALPIPANFYKPIGKQTKGPKVRHNQWRYVDFDGDGRLDLITGIEDWSDYGWDDAWNSKGEWTNGPLHGFVLIHRNLGTTEQPIYDPPQKLEADGQSIDLFGCPSPNFADFDGDGDLDLLCGEFLDGFTYFENTGNRTNPSYRKGERLKQRNGELLSMDLEMIVPVAFDWDRDGDWDLITGDEDGRVALIENITPLDPMPKTKTPWFAPPVYFQQEADTLKSGALATPYGCDWDNDGDYDLVSGNTAGYIELFENLSGANTAMPKWGAPQKVLVDGKPFRIMAGKNGSIQGPAEAKWGYTTIQVVDWDGDGNLDILFNSIHGRVQWLRNVGTRSQPVFKEAAPIEVEWEGTTPKPKWTWWEPKGKELDTQWRTTPVAVDLNRDGLIDLVMLDQEGYLVFFQRYRNGDRFKLKHPVRNLVDTDGKALRFNEKLAGGSGRRKLCMVDWNGDGNFDLLLNSANADLYLGEAPVDNQYRFKRVGTLAQQNIEGHDVSPTTVDFDGDGVQDFVGGAEDGRFYFLKNPRSAR